jgi:hypothetical protein
MFCVKTSDENDNKYTEVSILENLAVHQCEISASAIEWEKKKGERTKNWVGGGCYIKRKSYDERKMECKRVK